MKQITRIAVRYFAAMFFAGFVVSVLLADERAGDVAVLEPVRWPKHVVVEGARSSINAVVATDVDSDGHQDVIASYDWKVVVHFGVAKGDVEDGGRSRVIAEFSRAAGVGGSCIHACLLDCDGDGDLDYVGATTFAGRKWKVFWLERPNGSGFNDRFGDSWRFRFVDEEIDGVHCLIRGDVNGDGRDDLIANSFNGPESTAFPNSIVWLECPSADGDSDAWTRHVFADKDAPGGSHYMGFGDVNGDDRADIACGAKGTDGFENGRWFAWWEQPADPTVPWRKHVLATNELGATNIHPGDFDGDGVCDFFATRGHGDGVLFFRGPSFEIEQVDRSIAGPHCLVTADLDGDGDLDAATCGRATAGRLVWYENDGRAQFAIHSIAEGQGCYDLRSVDLDGDGDLDLLLAGHGSKNVVWFENPR